MNIGFMKRMKDGLPWVRVKLAMSLDGRTALANGESQWITGEAARNDVHRWRARSSAIMTGVGTVLADNPQLNVRLSGFKGTHPLRVVLDARLQSPVSSKMFSGEAGEAMIFTAAEAAAAAGPGTGSPAAADDATWAGAALSGAVQVGLTSRSSVPDNDGTPGSGGAGAPVAEAVAAPGAGVTAPAAEAVAAEAAAQASSGDLPSRRAALAAHGVCIEEVPLDGGFLDLSAVLRRLGDLEVNELLVEAGPVLAGQLLTTFFVDELLLYIGPKLLGPQGRPLVNLPELKSLQDALGFSLFDAKKFGEDLRLRLRPK